MKATGIVRRIDDLGRVVIPKELRRTLRICEGDPLEIFTGSEGITFRKYSALEGNMALAEACVKAAFNAFQLSIIVCDQNQVLEAGRGNKALNGTPISAELEELLRTGKEYVRTEKDDPVFPAKKHGTNPIQIMVPIRNGEECCGAVIILASDDEVSEAGVNCARMVAAMLSDPN